ncbi:uncharacterized protein LOC131876219 [Cryptomeria japonica]|uniref:uncharacterized protein LOC131876219 n=1 Tax=Cryptomeria japonica TaxID=3369 RepID=UPI0027DA7A7F|nr:uncharacterized protein LOC131876219 [Cryptomeria japonica]
MGRGEEEEEVEEGGGGDSGGGGVGQGVRDRGIVGGLDRGRGGGGVGGLDRGGRLLLGTGGVGRVEALLAAVPGQLRVYTHPQDAQIRALYITMQELQAQVLAQQCQIMQIMVKRDAEREHWAWAEDLSERLERAMTSAPM